MSDFNVREKIAIKLLGWSRQSHQGADGPIFHHPAFKYPVPLRALPAYEVEMGAAWRVVEFMRERGWGVEMRELDLEEGGWICEFEQDEAYLSSDMDSMPMAICKAAIAALEAAND